MMMMVVAVVKVFLINFYDIRVRGLVLHFIEYYTILKYAKRLCVDVFHAIVYVMTVHRVEAINTIKSSEFRGSSSFLASAGCDTGNRIKVLFRRFNIGGRKGPCMGHRWRAALAVVH